MALRTSTYTFIADGTQGTVQHVVLTSYDAGDKFKLSFNGVKSAFIESGVNYDAPGIKAALEAVSTVAALGLTVTVSSVSAGGFTVTFSDVPGFPLTVTDGTGSATGVVRFEIDLVGSDRVEDGGGRLRGRGPYTLKKVTTNELVDTGATAELLIEGGLTDDADDYAIIIYDTGANGINDKDAYPRLTAATAADINTAIAGTAVEPIFYGPVRITAYEVKADGSATMTLFYEPRGDQRF